MPGVLEEASRHFEVPGAYRGDLEPVERQGCPHDAEPNGEQLPARLPKDQAPAARDPDSKCGELQDAEREQSRRLCPSRGHRGGQLSIMVRENNRKVYPERIP